MRYPVQSRLRHDRQRFAAGDTVTLTDVQALPLLRLGVIGDAIGDDLPVTITTMDGEPGAGEQVGGFMPPQGDEQVLPDQDSEEGVARPTRTEGLQAPVEPPPAGDVSPAGAAATEPDESESGKPEETDQQAAAADSTGAASAAPTPAPKASGKSKPKKGNR